MKNLHSLTNSIKGCKVVNENENASIEGFTLSSKQAKEGIGFIAIKGTKADGHDYIEDAIKNGCRLIFTQKTPTKYEKSVTYVVCEDTASIAGQIASNFYDYPSESMTVVGVTGTNGKTTVCFMLYQMYMDIGRKSGLISTIEIKIGDTTIPTKNTTPDAITIQNTLHKMKEEGCQYVFIEVSSHALIQKRIEDIKFRCAAFTNITHDHLDYHGSFDNYIKAKKTLFDALPSDAISVINADDKNAKVMVQNTQSKVISYGIKTNAKVRGKLQEISLEGMEISIDGINFWSNLTGHFNVYNLLTAYTIAVNIGMDKEVAIKHLSKFRGAKGRFETFRSNSNKIGIIDYAHTPDAIKNTLSSIQKVKAKDKKLIAVVGCGGDRDRLKRPLMANIASSISDKVILTSDNPRTENPTLIIQDMEAGVQNDNKKKVLKIQDRQEAIKTAVMLAGEGDIIAVLGKGHENYQEIGTKRFPFDDRKILEELINKN